MIQEERSVFWEVIVSVIVRKKVHMNMCLVLTGYRNTAVRVYNAKALRMVVGKEKVLTVNCIVILI